MVDLAVIGAAVLGLAGCGSSANADIDFAKITLDEAVAEGAEKYAADAMRAALTARDALTAELNAQQRRWFKSYDKVKDLAVAAQQAADKAWAAARARKASIIARARSDDARAGPNLFRNGDFSQGLEGWGRPPAPGVELRVDRASGKDVRPELRIHVSDAAQHVVLLQGIMIQPDTPYVYEMEVKSSGPVVALYWDSDVGRFDSEKIFPEWTKLHYVFISPHRDGRPQSCDFHPVLTKGAGDIEIRNVGLRELDVQ